MRRCRNDGGSRGASSRARSVAAVPAGFSLIELVVVLAVVAIFATLALPSYSGVIRANRATTGSNGLLTALNLARTEAVTRRARVSVCAGAGNACAGETWNRGWIVFVDYDAPGMDSDKDEVLRVWPALAEGDNFTGDRALVSFRLDGSADAATNWGLKPRDCRQDQQRDVRLALSGHASVSRKTCS